MHIILFLVVGFFFLHGLGTKLKERQEKDARGELTELDKAPGKILTWGCMTVVVICLITLVGNLLIS